MTGNGKDHGLSENKFLGMAQDFMEELHKAKAFSPAMILEHLGYKPSEVDDVAEVIECLADHCTKGIPLDGFDVALLHTISWAFAMGTKFEKVQKDATK